MDIVEIDTDHLFKQLQLAYYELSSRGLVRAARFAAEALVGLDLNDDDAHRLTQSVEAPQLAPQTAQAKAYFDSQEFLRCWNALESRSKQRRTLSSIDMFLRFFSRYHAGEARKEDAMGAEVFVDRTKENSTNSSVALNPFLEELIAALDTETIGDDPFLLYLRGIVLRARKQQPEAIEALVQSCVLYPYNWSCWLELRACFTRLAETQAVLDRLTTEFMKKSGEDRVMLSLFRCFASEELDPDATIQLLEKSLLPLLPAMDSLYTQLARIVNVDGQYERASELFEGVICRDPFRLEDLDVYSNLLYVNEQRTKLAFLAQKVAATDKYRTESCCIVANYYSLVGEHERAVQYYQRAVLLNSNYISAWTLMGHEYVELGNPHAAIETYRKAVDLAPYDYRLWFGLGQAYEVLCMYFFALYYFQRALSLHPGDVRMWDSLGNCYEQLHRYDDAVTAFEQAAQINEGDVYYAYRLGMALHRVGKTDEALKYIIACAVGADQASNTVQSGAGASALKSLSDDDPNFTALQNASDIDKEEEESEWPLRARLWLAKRAMSLGKYAEALHWARRIDHGTREMLEEARSLERESRMHVQNKRFGDS